MGAYIDNVVLDKNGYKNIWIRYRDNGYCDTVQHTSDTPADMIKWLKLWYSDTAGGIHYIDRAIDTIEEHIKNK